MKKNNFLSLSQKIIYSIIFLLMSFAILTANGQEKFAYKNIGPSSPYVSFELTLDANPKFLTNWEFNFSGDINSNWRLNGSYQHFGSWSEILWGFDYLLWNPELFKGKSEIDFRIGGKAGTDLKTFAVVVYLKEEVRLISWRGHGTEKFSCKNKIKSLNLVCYQNLCRNSRCGKTIYFEPRIGLSYRF